MVQLMPLLPKTPSSLASFKSRLILSFWYRLTQVVLKKEAEPGFQALSKGLIVLLCAEVVRQGVPDQQWIADVVAPPSVAVWLT